MWDTRCQLGTFSFCTIVGWEFLWTVIWVMSTTLRNDAVNSFTAFCIDTFLNSLRTLRLITRSFIGVPVPINQVETIEMVIRMTYRIT